MNSLLPWAFLCTIPGLLLTALGVGRAGTASLLGPIAVLLAGGLWLMGDHAPLVVSIADWLPMLGDGTFALRLDSLSAAMLTVIGTVASCVYVYSLAYMHDDPGQRRFFALLDFFVATMCLLVLAGNLVVLVAGWAGVGIASFLLISFWRDKEGTLGAGMQALAANAIGDAALLLAVVLLPSGQADLVNLHALVTPTGTSSATMIGALLVVAAAAKSAQGPLYFWLPSAMAGPTPVSALIHAATMVAAGVYLLCRMHLVLAQAPDVLHVVAWLGVLTALVAAIASLQQTNYKKGLAYSTLSQLGYMFAAIGFGAPFAAFFHLFTHASFKALLFLVAGIVIHATDGEEELGKLGGLRRQLGATGWLALVGSLALIGLPLLTAGAFSKDLVLEAGLEHAPMLGYLLLGGVVLTGLYTGRLWFAVFGRSDSHLHAHAPGMLLLGPVALLAVGAVVLGWAGNPLGEVLAPALGKAPAVHAWSTLGAIAGGLGLCGFVLAGAWVKAKGSGAALPSFRGSWVDVASGLSDGCARLVASVHDGRVVTAIVFSLFGAGIVTLVAVLRH